jgi:hypothetical protein
MEECFEKETNRYEFATENNNRNGRCGAKGLFACGLFARGLGRQTYGGSCFLGDPNISEVSKCYGLLVLIYTARVKHFELTMENTYEYTLLNDSY